MILDKVPINYYSNFISSPNEAMDALISLDWEKREAPRQEYYCNDIPRPYVYGKGKGQRLYEPRPYTETILQIRENLENLTKTKFEVCFLNRYLNQSDHLGWHADDSPEMDDARPIGIVSLGVEREIWFKEKDSNSEIHKLLLESGSLCVMAAGMQITWQHRIPKASFKCKERISLTFRGYKEI